MSPPTPQIELVGESAAPESHRSLPTPFLTKTYQLVDDPAIDDIISWNEDGTTFVVWRPAEFARDLLPKYFKHNNFSSFVRQLNTYGFRKIVPDQWEFANDCFKRGEKRLLCDIHRRKINATPQATVTAPATAPPAAAIPVAVPVTRIGSPANSAEEQVLSSTSSPAAAPSTSGRSTAAATDLFDENERLRKENMHLNHELSQMKTLCNNIMLLMSNYANSQQESGSGSGGGAAGGFHAAVAAAAAMAGKEEKKLAPPPLELMPMKSASSSESSQDTLVRVKPEESGPGGSPMLFGVHIGVKRLRVDDEGSVEDQQQPLPPVEEGQGQGQQQQQQQQRMVKSEPNDRARDAEETQQEQPWLAIDLRPNQRVCN